MFLLCSETSLRTAKLSACFLFCRCGSCVFVSNTPLYLFFGMTSHTRVYWQKGFHFFGSLYRIKSYKRDVRRDALCRFGSAAPTTHFPFPILAPSTLAPFVSQFGYQTPFDPHKNTDTDCSSSPPSRIHLSSLVNFVSFGVGVLVTEHTPSFSFSYRTESHRTKLASVWK